VKEVALQTGTAVDTYFAMILYMRELQDKYWDVLAPLVREPVTALTHLRIGSSRIVEIRPMRGPDSWEDAKETVMAIKTASPDSDAFRGQMGKTSQGAPWPTNEYIRLGISALTQITDPSLS